MQLSKRLQAVASLVTPNNKVADVGCDHAYTSIYLVENSISPHVIAMDVNQGPMERARENVRKYGYEDRIDIRKSDGLKELAVKEVDTILIAGMGGALTIQILSERVEIVKEIKELILQPQSEIHLVRRMLSEIGFYIIEENMIKEDGKYYVMIKAKAKALVLEKENLELTREEHFHFGRVLLEQQHPVLLEFLMKELSQYRNIDQLLKSEVTQHSLLRQKEIRLKTELIEQGVSYY